MKINKISIRNIRCWYDEHDFQLSKYNAFIGENSSGKSSLQDAIYIGTTQTSVSDEIISRDSEISAYILTSFSFSRSDIEQILINIQENIPRKENLNPLAKEEFLLWNNLVIRITKKYIEGQERESIYEILVDDNISSLVAFDQYVQTFVRRNLSTHQPVIDHIITTLRLSIRDSIENSILRIPAYRSLAYEHVKTRTDFSTTHSGNKLKTLLFNAKNSQDKQLMDRFETFQSLVENLSFTPGKPIIKTSTGEIIELLFQKSSGEQISIEEVGDGIKEAIIIIGLCILNSDKVILIEEPEKHLHPRALRELREILKYELSGQVIISTHNPVFINEIDDDTSIFKIIKEDNKSRAIKITNKDELLEFRKEFGLFNSDFLFEDILVFVEGKIDVQVFSSWFEILYPEDMSVRFISMGGKGDVSSTIAISLVLQLDQSFNYFVILDKDEETKEEIENKIITSLKGKIPKLLEKIGGEVIKEKIIVLSRKNLEEYFDKATRVFAELLEIDEKEVIEFFEKSSMSLNRKLRRLFYKYGKGKYKSFRKSKHIPLIAEKLKKEDISGEIIKIFQLFKTK